MQTSAETSLAKGRDLLQLCIMSSSARSYLLWIWNLLTVLFFLELAEGNLESRLCHFYLLRIKISYSGELGSQFQL